MLAAGEKRLAYGGSAREGPRIMRVAVFVLAALVFLAGLILDTGAVLQLLGALLWAHALFVAAVVLLIVLVAACWDRLGRRKGAKRRGAVGAGPRPAAPRKPRTGGVKGRSRGGKRKPAK
jgi:hypothetical protein